MNMHVAGVGGSGAPEAVSGASGYSSPTTKMSNLFAQIDTSGSGTISQSQFNQAFETRNPRGVFKAAGADAVFSQLDPTGSGTVSQSNFVQGMTGLMRSLRGGAADGAAASQSTSPANALTTSLQSLNQLGVASDASANGGVGGTVNLLA